jgi:hypothetical protein
MVVIILTSYWVKKSRGDCGTYEGAEKCIQNLEGKCEEKELGRHRCRGKVILKWTLKKHCICVAQDMNRWQYLLKMVTNLWVL